MVNTFIIMTVPHSLDIGWRLLHYSMFCSYFFILPSCLCSEFFRMKSTTNRQAAITADYSLLPTPKGFCFPGCQANLKGTAYMSEELLSSF